MYASSVASAQKHKDKLAASLNKRVAKGKMAQEAADDLMSRVLVEEFEAAADADLVIECVAENMAVKKELLGRLDALCKDEPSLPPIPPLCPSPEDGSGPEAPSDRYALL